MLQNLPDFEVPEAPCTSPNVGGVSLTDVCSASPANLFLAMLNTLVAYNVAINDPCGRITPIKKPDISYDFIVVGGKMIDANTMSIIIKKSTDTILSSAMLDDAYPGN